MYKKFLILLESSGKTPYQVAKDTGVSTATLTNWKQGNYQPKIPKLKTLADYFGVTVDYFLLPELENTEKGV
ncbi:transcriptional regulator [Chryseobacterium mucoviscidosis]|nr:transcriptional regulator [Chryseobacterium mucoviscidosis]